MEQSQSLTKSSQEKEEEEQIRMYQEFEDLASSLPTVKGCSLKELRRYNGCYLPTGFLVGVMAVEKLFKPRDTDIISATLPKSGSVWIKALLFAIINRNNSHSNALSSLNPHECVPFLETQLYGNNRVPNLDLLPSPRLFSTHMPFGQLSNSILNSGCKIVYLCRNFKDVFVSYRHFISKIRESYSVTEAEAPSMEDDFDEFCKGHSSFGPFWDHALGYWNAKKYNVLFMRYEELIDDPVAEVKRLGEFVGFPFTVEEEKDGVVEEIVDSCKFNNLRDLKVNNGGKTKMLTATLDNRLFFRQGGIGGWTKDLTPDMVRRLDEIVNTKFEGSGLTI